MLFTSLFSIQVEEEQFLFRLVPCTQPLPVFKKANRALVLMHGLPAGFPYMRLMEGD